MSALYRLKSFKMTASLLQTVRMFTPQWQGCQQEVVAPVAQFTSQLSRFLVLELYQLTVVSLYLPRFLLLVAAAAVAVAFL